MHEARTPMLWGTLRLHRRYTGTEKGAAEHPMHLRRESGTRVQAKPIHAHDRSRALLSIVVVFAARCLIIMLFLPFSALDKILNYKAALGEAAQVMPARSIAATVIFAGFIVEVVMSLAILSGVADRLAAVILAGYCVATALLWKQFWKAPDFRLQGASRGRETFWDFLKNLALAGGFLLLAFGTNAAGVKRFLDHPLASTQPYRVIQSGGG
jgi:putative oxidoreductase